MILTAHLLAPGHLYIALTGIPAADDRAEVLRVLEMAAGAQRQGNQSEAQRAAQFPAARSQQGNRSTNTIPAFLRGNTPPCAEPVGVNVAGRGLPRAGANGGRRVRAAPRNLRDAADATSRELVPSPQDRGLASVSVGGMHSHPAGPSSPVKRGDDRVMRAS